MSATILRRSPFYGLDSVSLRMLDRVSTPGIVTPIALQIPGFDSTTPPVDIFETQEEIVVAASLPNLDLEKTNIEVMEDQLTVSGSQRPLLEFAAEENAVLHFKGVPRYGQFKFTFQLPKAVDANQTQAKYENGVLQMRFLKVQAVRPVKITVQNQIQPKIETARLETLTESSKID